MEQERVDASGEMVAHISFWGEHGGKIAAGIATAFLLGAGAWAVQMDRQSVRIGYALEQIQNQLKEQNGRLGELNQLEKRVTRIEDNRFTERDAEKIRLRSVEMVLRK